jgi:hypothetical protein
MVVNRVVQLKTKIGGPSISAKALLSVTTNERTIGRHVLPAADDELKNLLSFNASDTGLRQALSVMLSLLISSRSAITAASRSSVLFQLS